MNTRRTVPEIIAAIRENPLETPEQIEQAKRDINLVLYERTAKHPYKQSIPGPAPHATCSQCPESKSLFNITGTWFCKDHIPTHITFPVGLHGDDFKAFQAKREGK